MAVIPATSAPNHTALDLGGGWLQVKSCPLLNTTRNFTVELWARFGPVTPDAQVLASKGTPGPGNWHIIYQTDGTVRANVFGAMQSYLFDEASGGPVAGEWYHLAAVYEDIGNGRMRIRTFVNGHPRDAVSGPALQDTSATDLFLGSYPGGQLPFFGAIDEFRFTPRVLGPKDFLLAGTRPVEEAAAVPSPDFVTPGTAVTPELRKHAGDAPVVLKPEGYTYFFTRACVGLPRREPPPPGPHDRGFEWALLEAAILNGGPPIGYHFAVKPGGKYAVAVGFYEPSPKPGERVQDVVIDGRRVDRLDVGDVGKGKPFVRIYRASDLNRDGFLEVTCFHHGEESGRCATMSIVWIFQDEDAGRLDAAQLARGECPVAPIYYVRCGREEGLRGHVGYPPISPAARAKMVPLPPVVFGRDPDWPQPVDPLDVDIRGDLADRIHAYMDRWGYAGRDQLLVADFLSDSGWETASRFLNTYSQLSRLMHVDLDLDPSTRALLATQDRTSPFPGSFVGGTPRRTAFLWSQGMALGAIMSSYDRTGDARLLDAGRRLSTWYDSYLHNGDLAAANYFTQGGKFSREGATVGQLGKGGLEGLMYLYWRTHDPSVLATAKEVADLNRKWGGVAWMIHGDIPNERPELEGWHIHANLTTLRGFPWLYAATGDRSYLDDAVAGCDRVFDRATWGTGGVLEQIPWSRDPDPHDETCQTSDELQLSYLLGDFTGQGRFFDRAEEIYWNHIRYMQLHQGDFTAFNRLPGPQRGGDAWFCCGWWGGKAMYEVARHLYASSPTAVWINGFMPSSAKVRLAGGTVDVDMQADLPRSGDVRMTLSPRGVSEFTLKIRVPGWAKLEGVTVNGAPLAVEAEAGYIAMARRWRPGDRVDVHFDLPLRVVLDSAWDTLPPAKVSVDGAAPVDARRVLVFRGPVVVAQFGLAQGCDLDWAYTGDHPDLFDTLDSAADVVEARGWRFDSAQAPALTRVDHTPDGVRLTWELEPRPGWRLRRTALVHAGTPVTIDATAQLIAPSAEEAAAVTSVRLCGVRMRTRGFPDYRPAVLMVGENAGTSSPLEWQDQPLPGHLATLDNGYIQFRVDCRQRLAAEEGGSWAGLFALPQRDGTVWHAEQRLTITGQSQFAAPVIRAAW
jgi:hypothetical protein